MSSAHTISIAEFERREAIANDILARKLEQKRAALATGPVSKQIGELCLGLAGFLGTCAVAGYAMYGSLGAMASPFVIAMPAAVLLEAAGFINRPVDVSDKDRRQAFEAAGLTGIRDPRLAPTWRDRLASLFGRRTADAVMAQAKSDGERGVWGSAPTDVRYRVQGDVVAPELQPILEAGPVTKIRFQADGGILMAHSVGGKLQSQGGHPSSCWIGADGYVKAAAWHDSGAVAETWKAGQDVPLTINIQMLAAECHSLADELRLNGGQDAFADAIDELGRRALDLGCAGYATLPLTLDPDGRVSVDALDDYVTEAVNGSAAARR